MLLSSFPPLFEPSILSGAFTPTLPFSWIVDFHAHHLDMAYRFAFLSLFVLPSRHFLINIIIYLPRL